MDGDPTPALTGRRRTRPPSIGCRNPQQPEPGRAPLISAKPAVQSNRATSGVGLRLDGLVAIDVDADDQVEAERITQLAQLIIGSTPAIRVGREPRRQLLYRHTSSRL